MNELQVFTSPEFGQVRTVTIEEEPWFVGKWDIPILKMPFTVMLTRKIKGGRKSRPPPVNRP